MDFLKILIECTVYLQTFFNKYEILEKNRLPPLMMFATSVESVVQ